MVCGLCIFERGRLKEQKRVYLLEELSPAIELAVALGR